MFRISRFLISRWGKKVQNYFFPYYKVFFRLGDLWIYIRQFVSFRPKTRQFVYLFGKM